MRQTAPDRATERARGVLVARGELAHPAEHRRRIDPHTTLGQQPGHIGVAQAIAQVPPHGERDAVGRVAVAGERRRTQEREPAVTAAALVDLPPLAIAPVLARRHQAAAWTSHRCLTHAACSSAPPYQMRKATTSPHDSTEPSHVVAFDKDYFGRDTFDYLEDLQGMASSIYLTGTCRSTAITIRT